MLVILGGVWGILPGSCTVAYSGTAVNITASGWGSGAACQALEQGRLNVAGTSTQSTGGSYASPTGQPFGDLVCEDRMNAAAGPQLGLFVNLPYDLRPDGATLAWPGVMLPTLLGPFFDEAQAVGSPSYIGLPWQGTVQVWVRDTGAHVAGQSACDQLGH